MVENVIQIKGGTMINVDVSVKSILNVKKILKTWKTCSYKNGKYLANIMDDYVWWNYRGGREVIRRKNKNSSNKF